MFENEYVIQGRHAKFLKFLSQSPTREDSATKNSAKLFERYIDAYMNAALFGLLYSRKAESEYSPNNRVHINFNREREKCIFLYRLVMLLDETENLSVDDKINRAFRYDNSTAEELQKNIELFNDYVRGGLEDMYEKFTENCLSPEDYLEKTFEVISAFQKDLEGVSKEEISKLIDEP